VTAIESRSELLNGYTICYILVPTHGSLPTLCPASRIDSGNEVTRGEDRGSSPRRHVQQVAVVRDDEDGLPCERQLQDAVVLVVVTVGDGLVGFEHFTTGRFCDLNEDGQVLLDGLFVPSETSVNFSSAENTVDVREDVRAQ